MDIVKEVFAAIGVIVVVLTSIYGIVSLIRGRI